MKLGQLIEFNNKNVFLQKLCEKLCEQYEKAYYIFSKFKNNRNMKNRRIGF